MTTLSRTPEAGHGRSVLVAISIATAAAAVTAGMALNERPRSDAELSPAQAEPAPSRAVKFTPVPRRRAPLAESATAYAGGIDATTGTDPSVPAAAEALDGVPGAAAELPTTF